MKKNLIFLLLTIGFLTGNRCLYAGWPINRIPAIEGKVVDITTEEGIENVVIRAGWTKRTPSLDGCQDTYIADEIVISSTDGSYKIPSKTIFYILFPFDFLRINFIHPLYETKELGWDAQEIKMLKKDIKGLQGEYKNRKIQLDIKLLSLGEKYGKTVESLELIDESEKKKREIVRDFSSLIGSKEAGFHWLVLMKMGIPINLEGDFKKWDTIASKLFVDNYVDEWDSYNKFKERIKENIQKIRKDKIK